MNRQGWLGVVSGCLLSTIAWGQQAPTNALAVWLMSDVFDNLTDGDRVGVWPDSSGSGCDATQPEAALRPRFVGDAVNGRPVIRFDGSGDFLANTAFTNASPEETLVLVARRLGSKTSTYQCLLMRGAESDTRSGKAFIQLTHEWNVPALEANFTAASLDILNPDAGWDTNAFTVITLTRGAADGGRSTLHLNGQEAGSGTGTQAVAAGFHLGCWNGRDAAMDVAELRIYDKALTDAERQQVEQEVKAKYGIGDAPPAPPVASVPIKETTPVAPAVVIPAADVVAPAAGAAAPPAPAADPAPAVAAPPAVVAAPAPSNAVPAVIRSDLPEAKEEKRDSRTLRPLAPASARPKRPEGGIRMGRDGAGGRW